MIYLSVVLGFPGSFSMRILHAFIFSLSLLCVQFIITSVIWSLNPTMWPVQIVKFFLWLYSSGIWCHVVCTKFGGDDSVTKVIPGFCIKYAKRSKNGSQKFTTENKAKAGESGIDNNCYAISNIKKPIIWVQTMLHQVSNWRWTKSTFCSSQQGEAFHVWCVWQTIPAVLLFWRPFLSTHKCKTICVWEGILQALLPENTLLIPHRWETIRVQHL